MMSNTTRAVSWRNGFQPEVAAVADGPSHDPPQHIAAAFVGRQDAVADEKSGGPAVIGNHFHGDVVGLAAP
jgi:hypothetical protein